MSYITVHTANTDDPNIFSQRTISSTELKDVFIGYDWNAFLVKANIGINKDIYYELPVKFENQSDKRALSFFPAGEPDSFGVITFYTRPKKIKKWFGLVTTFKEEYTTQTYEFIDVNDALSYVKAFAEKNYDYLEKRIK